jgi:hypothetical protein|tara:strand:- start:490 stop:1350 length:861 start_codon:yes stop_codon:yes gene_type:complete
VNSEFIVLHFTQLLSINGTNYRSRVYGHKYEWNFMVKVEFEMNPGLFLEKTLSRFKNNRTLQIISVTILLLLISKPVHSMYVDFSTPANAHERENKYVVFENDRGYITWISETLEVFSDQETISLTMDESDFPIEADGLNIIDASVSFYVSDYSDDNEETSGLGCMYNDGEDAYDSISAFAEHPSTIPQNTVSEYGDSLYLDLFEYPEFETYPFITGYTVDEIEEMYDSSEDVKGEYSFNFTGFVEAGESTFECERSDSSVTFVYEITLSYREYSVVEWNDTESLF